MGNIVPGDGNSVPARRPTMKREDKGKSKYQLKIERDDPNAVRLLRQKAMRQLGIAVDKGDVRAITFVVENTNALKMSAPLVDLSGLASLLSPPTEAPTKAPPDNLAISNGTQNFPDLGAQASDNTTVNPDIEVDDAPTTLPR
jgi:hypothetical protein